MSYYRYKAIISYDGYDYYGFQKQGELATIELELEKAFNSWLKKEIKVVGSGRTDKGVSALGQVIHFDLDFKIDPISIKKALNSFLPIQVRIVKVTKVNNDFHARFSAKKKEYRYVINIKEDDVFSYRHASFIKGLDISLMEEATKYLIGTHNFKSLCSAQVDERKSLVKTIYDIKVIKRKGFVTFCFIGDGFLKYQVRRMMGLLIDVGFKKVPVSMVEEIILKEDPTLSHRMADAEGLCLYKVWY